MSELEKVNLLSIDIIKTTISDIDNQKVIDEIRSSSEEIEERFLQNKNHTYYEDQRYPFGRPESEKLINVLTKTVSDIVGAEMVLTDIWTLTLDYGQSVSAHSHKSNTYMHQEEFYSIAYYPSAPEGSADLIFLVDACNTLEKSVSITPEEGGLVVFNSYLTHMTNRHRNKEEQRIVVSANFTPKQPNTNPTQDWSAYSRNKPQIKRMNKNGFRLTAQTIFGDEEYLFYEAGLKDWKVSFNKNIFDVNNVEVTDKKIVANFTTLIPMAIDVRIDLDILDNEEISGFIQIGEFMCTQVVGSRI